MNYILVLPLLSPRTMGYCWLADLIKDPIDHFRSPEDTRTTGETGKQGIRSSGSGATVDVVLELACRHASQEIRNPFESAIYLYDRPLTLSEIMDPGIMFL